METGIAIVVAKRTGIISPTAFLEPFDAASWMLVGVVAIHASTFTIFLFEWLSPSGFNMKVSFNNGVPSTAHRFSLFRTYWLVWAVLFQAAVHVDSPRGFTSRFMTNVWAMFAVVFLAIYTANLAAFMITREEFFEFSGIDDHRLCRPYSHKPLIKFSTIQWSHTDSTLAKYFREMHAYMRQFNKTTVLEGVTAVLSGEMDAFIYDGTVLDYLTSQDEDCRLLTVGSWYAMTGYGLAFPRNSKYLKMFNKRLLDFRENGDLERLRRYWMTGVCKPGKQEHKSSDPLALEQFLSAFLLLMAGILLAALLLFLEHLYFKYIRKHLAKTDRGGCCALISLSMGKSLTFRGAVYEAQDILRNHRCRDPICDTHLWKVKRELDVAQMRIKQLEKEMEVHGIKPPPCKRRRRNTSCITSCVGSSKSPDTSKITKPQSHGQRKLFGHHRAGDYRNSRDGDSAVMSRGRHLRDGGDHLHPEHQREASEPKHQILDYLIGIALRGSMDPPPQPTSPLSTIIPPPHSLDPSKDFTSFIDSLI
ncbi:hypothetical protein GWI33_004184 [Rhynchophorus ferrugineus]|uniref:Ionotropic glutamate receptor C-terminal domain-containing protein n=1 Tax=Rhynchophorus ferrugineus TaxID=354439 RepID=A0A834ILV8_RHYFE|nr:hypothetical protein GWI33_004184 [Rhynchophorus ferrugineus]